MRPEISHTTGGGEGGQSVCSFFFSLQRERCIKSCLLSHQLTLHAHESQAQIGGSALLSAQKGITYTEKFVGEYTVRVKIITGSLVTLWNLFPENYRYPYRLEIRMNYHYRYRLGARSHPFISIDSQLPSRKSFELISSKLPLPLPS